VLAGGDLPMTATDTLTSKDALTILREIDLSSKYRLTAGIYEGECFINGICYEKDDNLFLNINTDIAINDEINATLAINNIIVSGLIAPTDDNSIVLLARSLRYQIRTHP
jgi:hypothetical protein